MVRAAVVEKSGTAPVIQDIELAPLRFDEVLVRVVCTGICHTDVAWASGELFDAYPVVLGHESAGVVEATGADVTRVKPGDRVAIALAHHCGHCFFCETGRPILCGRRTDAPLRMLRGGEPLIQAFGAGGFSEATVVREASTIPLPDGVPIGVAAVIGCATSTGLGAVFNIADVRYGSTVAILGAGGIGLNVLMGCQIAGADRIVVADPNPERRQLALSFGATDVVASNEQELGELKPDGFEYVFECAGFAESMELAIKMTARGGTATIIGAPRPDVEIRINALEFVPKQHRIIGCLTGNVRPNVDFDRFYRLYLRGKLPLDRLITGTVPLEEIARGFEMCAQAQGIRTLVAITEE